MSTEGISWDAFLTDTGVSSESEIEKSIGEIDKKTYEKLDKKEIIEKLKLDLAKVFNNTPFNDVLEKTSTGVERDQTIPALYLRPNDFFRIEPENLLCFSPMLCLLSTHKSIIVGYEFFDEALHRYYDSKNNKYACAYKINRTDILGFERVGEVKFNRLKTSKTLKFIQGFKGAPGAGLIGGLIVGAVVKGAMIAEGKIVEETGTLYSLSFKENDEVITLDIICEQFYSTFEDFLSANWTNRVDLEKYIDTLVDEFKGDSQCFIATSLYGDCNHPKVMTLRRFRDDVLSPKYIGRVFIKLYYKYSPKFVEKLSIESKSNLLLNNAIRHILNFFILVLRTFGL